MHDSLNLSPTPVGEECAQVGSEDYRKNALLECQAFTDQIRRQFGPEPAGAKLKVKSNAHDFGTYYDVNVEFDSNNDEAAEFAYLVEGGIPEYWDSEAKEFLKANGYTLSLD